MSVTQALTPEQIAAYQAAARQRWEQEQRDLAAREQRAWAAARRAAQMLKERFGATRVVAFGSLIHPGMFNPWSDVDIAAWGIRSEDTLRAMEAASEVDDAIAVNLVDMNACRASLREVVEREGVDL
jgi:predicted nucleotidyltransferase